MKTFCFASMFFVLIATINPAIADLTGIQILSEHYHVDGEYSVFDYCNDIWYEDSYSLDSTGPSGISGRVSSDSLGLDPDCVDSPYGNQYAESSAGRFFAEASAGYVFSGAGSYAVASVSFQPETSGWLRVWFDVESPYGPDSWATLYDTTADAQLFRVNGYDSVLSPKNLWLDNTHVYSLYLDASSSQGDASYAILDLSFTPDVLYVDANSPNDPGSGTAEDPFRRIQYGIDAAGDGNAVMVLPGTYTGAGNRDLDFKGKAITVRSENPNDPNVVAATIIDCNGTAEDLHRGFYFHSGEDANSILEGFTITNGYGPNEPFGASEYSAGGAIYYISSSPTIRNCVFANNYSHYWGGAVHCDSSSAAFSNCTFKDNVSGDTGGGLYNRLSSITVTNCLFTDNSAAAGGGIYNIDGTSTVKNTLFVGNSATIAGGGLRNKRVASTIANCTFFDNQAPAGGAVHNVLCTGTTITNCILWSNPDTEIEGEAEVTYCDVEGGWSGSGNIDADPCFADPCNGDFHLLVDSPCIDSGDPNYVPAAGEADMDGEPRVFNRRVDMGADEYAVILYVSAYSLNDPGTGTRQDPYRRIQDALDSAMGGEEIHVGQGIYDETVTITSDLNLYGGYDCNNWAGSRDAGTTVISGDDFLPEDYLGLVCILDANVTLDGFTIRGARCSGIYCTSTDVGGRVVRICNNIIRYSCMDYDYSHQRGAGIYCDGYITAEITGNVIRDNWITRQDSDKCAGAGIYCGEYVRPVIRQNVIRDNFITNYAWEGRGGGICCASSECDVSGNFVANNRIDGKRDDSDRGYGEGGGIWVGGGIVCGNIVTGNSISDEGHYRGAIIKGGGIYSAGPATITDNVVVDNELSSMSYESGGETAEAYGGGIYAPNCVITFNTVSSNRCEADGGFVYWQGDEDGGNGIAKGGGIYAPSTTAITGNIVSNNLAGGYGGSANWRCGPSYRTTALGGDGIAQGGGVYAPGARIVNNTLVGNEVVATGGYGHFCVGYSADDDPNLRGVAIAEGAGIYGGNAITNTIIWANSPDELAGADCGNVAYCDIGDPVCDGQVGNISVDPCFADAEYHLQCDSPCVDAGDPQSPVGYEPFPNGGIINMGAYGGTAEAAKSCFGGRICEIEVDGDINGDCRIDAMDLRLMVFHWIEDVPPSPPPCETIVAGDLNVDCHIDFEDFCLIALHWCEDNKP